MTDKKWITYAVRLSGHIKKIFSEESDFHIDLKELKEENNFKEFMHALSTAAPCKIFNSMVHKDDIKDHLQFNQAMNALVFEFAHVEGEEEKKKPIHPDYDIYPKDKVYVETAPGVDEYFIVEYMDDLAAWILMPFTDKTFSQPKLDENNVCKAELLHAYGFEVLQRVEPEEED